nr:MAG TPA: hypothetical protein [Caudoviricetes sp.]
MVDMKKRIAAAVCAALMLAAPVQAQAMADSEVYALAEEIGGAYGICPELLQAIAWHESRYEEDASNGGCEGLMQVSEKWHRDRMEELGVTDLYDPRQNMTVAADYLAELFEEYGEPGMVLMKYNGDSTSVARYGKLGYGMSGYAEGVLQMSARMEREHGK